MQRYLTAIFNDRDHAEAAVSDLQAAGISVDEISVVVERHHHRTLIERLGHSDTPLVTNSNVSGQEDRELTETGMKAGAGLGSVVGLLAGIPLVLATGGGAGLLVAGAIAGILGGGVAGAAAGSLAGALIRMGVPHSRAEDIQNRVRSGAIMVSLRTDERHVPAIEDVFHRHGADEVLLTAVAGAVK